MSAEKIGDIKEQLKSITDSQLTQFIEELSALKVSRNMSVSTHHMLIFAA